MKQLLVAFIAFVHQVEDGDGPLSTCHNKICRWASRYPDARVSAQLTEREDK